MTPSACSRLLCCPRRSRIAPGEFNGGGEAARNQSLLVRGFTFSYALPSPVSRLPSPVSRLPSPVSRHSSLVSSHGQYRLARLVPQIRQHLAARLPCQSGRQPL